MSRYNQDNTRISTDGSTRDTQRIEGGDYLSWTWIQIDKELTRLLNRNRNNI